VEFVGGGEAGVGEPIRGEEAGEELAELVLEGWRQVQAALVEQGGFGAAKGTAGDFYAAWVEQIVGDGVGEAGGAGFVGGRLGCRPYRAGPHLIYDPGRR